MDIEVASARGRAEADTEGFLPPLVIALRPGQDSVRAELVAEVLTGATCSDCGIADPVRGIDPRAGAFAAPYIGHLAD